MAKVKSRRNLSTAQRKQPKNQHQQESGNQLIQQKDDFTANRQYKDTIFRMLLFVWHPTDVGGCHSNKIRSDI